MKIYEALYCQCIHESSYETISIHKTEKGAVKAKELHKHKTLKEDGEPREAHSWERWAINETKLLD